MLCRGGDHIDWVVLPSSVVREGDSRWRLRMARGLTLVSPEDLGRLLEVVMFLAPLTQSLALARSDPTNLGQFPCGGWVMVASVEAKGRRSEE